MIASLSKRCVGKSQSGGPSLAGTRAGPLAVAFGATTGVRCFCGGGPFIGGRAAHAARTSSGAVGPATHLPFRHPGF